MEAVVEADFDHDFRLIRDIKEGPQLGRSSGGGFFDKHMLSRLSRDQRNWN